MVERARINVCYVVATIKPWNIAAFHRRCSKLPGQWALIDSNEALTIDRLREIRPRYVFFPHWSWRVPSQILQEFNCICFHETDVPYGRGGSPLQNLIARGHTTTKVTALRMVEELDAGPVYLKRLLSLEGRAEEIFERAADLVYDMIGEIVAHDIVPVPQQGEAVVFVRRAPHESSLPQDGSPATLYDFIRMLDAPTYPKAFIDWGTWRIEFDRAQTVNDAVEAHVAIRKKNQS
jgi:methionyl-tRNA formyltransferase